MNKKILVIEDNTGIQMSLRDEFESEGYQVSVAGNGQEGLDKAKEEHPDLIILDIMLPLVNGFEVCQRLRKAGDHTPIIMLTAKDKEIDKILGLELGADDYVTKPFSLREMVSRVKTIFRRIGEYSASSDTGRIGDTEFDFKKYEAKKRGQMIEFTPLEYQLIHFLVNNREQVLTRDEILEKVWGENNVVVSLRTIDTHITNIRKKIEDDPADPKYILNIRGVGYKLTGG
jgi:DNA-binding response OmpR family regulator